MLIMFLLFLAAFPANHNPASHRPANPNPASLHVIVQNVQTGKGTINVALFAGKKDFLKTPVTAQIKNADHGTMEFDFTVPPGEYAIAAYQDLNQNKKLDAGLFHIPKEPYGFSNNYRPRMSAPVYEDCRIEVAGAVTSTIALK